MSDEELEEWSAGDHACITERRRPSAAADIVDRRPLACRMFEVMNHAI